MAKIIDLDILIPSSESIKFTGHKDLQTYEISSFIPSAISFVALDDEISKGTDLDYQNRLVEVFLQHQYKHMSREWIDDNISMPIQTIIATLIIKKIGDGNKALTKVLESGKPKKNPKLKELKSG